ncbi:MAG: LysR family transcriptional regulator [Roseovarius sp.]|nr:LysR family transcriptional regulator [Roseovarius sp.]
MDVRWLEDVLMLLEEGNLTRAAKRRNITQPAFSRRIKSFEDWLGAPVLERGVNRVEIRPALIGNEAEIRALLGRLGDLRGKLANYDAGHATITIAAQHAPVFSAFPDMALCAIARFAHLRFRLRPGNLRDCVAMFLRGDAPILLCYEDETMAPMPFGDSVMRTVWGTDQLIPVIGGGRRYAVARDGSIPGETPAIVYPDESYFGEALMKTAKPFGTHAFSGNPVCETAFSTGIKELVLGGLGIGWLPFSMCRKELERGEMVSLATELGCLPLDIVLYSDANHDMSRALIEVWSDQKSARQP